MLYTLSGETRVEVTRGEDRLFAGSLDKLRELLNAMKAPTPERCKHCGSVDVRLTEQKDLFVGWVKVLLCKKCGKMTEAEV